MTACGSAVSGRGTSGGSPDREIHAGCVDLRRRVEVLRPRLHVFGHIHQDPGVWRHGPSTFVNATTAEGARPAAVVELDSRLLAAALGAARPQNETLGAANASELAVK